MKTLYFLRHAKAEPGGSAATDPQRILSSRGREACVLMGGYMKSKAYTPSFALVSPSARTKETWQRVIEAADITPPCRLEDTLYLASAEEIVRAVQMVQNTYTSVMVVGHNPGMHHSALLLSDPSRNRLRTALELKYPTCSLTMLRFDISHWEHIAPSKGKLVDFITPGDL